MKRILTATCLCLSLLVIGADGQQQSDGPLTNASIVKLVKAGFKEKTVIAIIANQPTKFNLETEQLINLKRNGVNENIILAMLSAQLGTVVVSNNDEEWANEPFRTDAPSQGSSTSIFGSGSSSRSSSRSRGGMGGNENEGNVSGSATVRIIRPPAEGGDNGAAKLEKTPTLTNEGVISLVEAGFSEGTIIKRIEASPVDFDLSPKKLIELQKRRVSESIIGAMNAAMGK